MRRLLVWIYSLVWPQLRLRLAEQADMLLRDYASDAVRIAEQVLDYVDDAAERNRSKKALALRYLTDQARGAGLQLAQHIAEGYIEAAVQRLKGGGG